MGKVLPGVGNPNWRGGRVIDPRGYVLLRVGTAHPLADCRGYAYEHRVVASAMLGRPLRPDEHVHHKDENPQNNAPENLAVLTIAEHRAEHRRACRGLRLPGEENALVQCACGCGASLTKYDQEGRPRSYISGHNLRTALTRVA